MFPFCFELFWPLTTSFNSTRIWIAQGYKNCTIRSSCFFEAGIQALSHSHLSTLILTFVILVNNVQVCVGQEKTDYSIPGYHVRHYTDENGLPQNSVKSVTRDSRGNIWLATERGLVRFDGKNFFTFDNFGGSFLDRNISGFRINPKTGSDDFFALNNERTYIRISKGKAVTDTGANHELQSKSFYSRKGRITHVIEALPDLNENALFKYHPVLSIIPSTFGTYFVYDGKNIEYYAGNRRTKSFYFPDKNFWRFFRVNNDIYYLNKTYELLRFKGGNSDASPDKAALRGAILSNPAFSSNEDCQIFWNNCSNQAFVLVANTLYMLHAAKDGTLISEPVLHGFDFKAQVIKTVYYDKETESVFLGSQLNGLFIVKKEQFRTIKAEIPLADNVYYGQTTVNANSLLSAEGIMFTSNKKNDQVLAQRLQLLASRVDWDQRSVLKDKRGNIWCKKGEDLFRFDQTGTQLLATWRVPGEFTQVYEGNNGRIWVGTNILGLYYVDPDGADPNLRFFTSRNLPSISWIQHQTTDILWVATGKGLFKIDLGTKKRAYIKGLENIYVRSLYIPTGRNEVWITTYKDGLFLLKNGKLTQFPIDKKQYIASAHCIVEDNNGFFWITTNKGLFQIKKDDLLSYSEKAFDIYYHYYSKTVGFNTNEFNGGCQPCAVRIQDGLVSLPSMNGLVWFVPEKIRPELPNREIFIEDLTVDNVGVEFNSNTITLTSKASEVALKVTTPYFGDPYNLRMSYRILKDGEPLMDWKVLNNEIMAISTPPLEAGNYTLSIRKLRGFGLHNYQYKNLHINVEKQWYETWWFRGILVAAILLIFYGILKQRVKKISKQNLILEAKVNERTQHLEEALRVLNASGKELEQRGRTQIRMIASVTHDVRNPVRHMTKALRYVQDLIEKNQLEAAIGAVKKIEQNSDRIYHLVDNMISFIKPEVYRTNSDFKRANLSALVSERIQIFKEMNGAMINLKISPEHFVNTDPTLLSVVIHNLVDNAIKAKKGNRIEICTESTDEDLHLIFSDEGPGMPRELLGWLNTTSSDENTSLPASYEGLGLLMVKEITKILKIAVYAENNPGARISLKFIRDTSK